jgi:hypothetical protein
VSARIGIVTRQPGVLADVLRLTKDGATPPRVAAELGVDLGVVEAALDLGVRLGVVATPTATRREPSACGSCSTRSPLACAGCPFFEPR